MDELLWSLVILFCRIITRTLPPLDLPEIR